MAFQQPEKAYVFWKCQMDLKAYPTENIWGYRLPYSFTNGAKTSNDPPDEYRETSNFLEHVFQVSWAIISRRIKLLLLHKPCVVTKWSIYYTLGEHTLCFFALYTVVLDL